MPDQSPTSDERSAPEGEATGYRSARFLRDTPYKSVTEWRRAMIAAIPEADRCVKCSGSGADVIRASNGGIGEIVRCWPCQGTGRTLVYPGAPTHA